jgi:hypothetical protein
MRWSLRCAGHDEAVTSFGRDDNVFLCEEQGQQKRQGQQQIPFGDDNKKDKGNGRDEMRGALRCAGHDEAVTGFGRDDNVLLCGMKIRGKSRNKDNSRSPSG